MNGDGLSIRQMAMALQISVGKVAKSLKALEDFGIIERTHNNNNHLPDKIILRDADKAWELNPTGKSYSRTWRWK
jgi:DNA-binding transcriptional regulator YhcF (GntR family)